MTGGSVRLVPLLALAMGAACARPPRAAAPPRPGLFGPSSQPVLLPPRQFEPDVPRTDAQWRAVGREAAPLLSQYVAINTTNPPGNELQTANWLKAVLAREGIDAEVFEPRPGKANLYARIKGDGSARPLILLNPMDVVLASPEYWKVDPFSGTVQDGYLWGRGALDMKGEAITQLLSLLTLKRAGVPLRRDVIFLATADEEIGGGVGAGWFVEHHPEVVQDAEFLLTEGCAIRPRHASSLAISPTTRCSVTPSRSRDFRAATRRTSFRPRRAPHWTSASSRGRSPRPSSPTSCAS